MRSARECSPKPSVASGIERTDEIVLDRDEIAERMSGNLCRCGAYANSVDHIVPVVLGGGHDLANLRPACSFAV